MERLTNSPPSMTVLRKVSAEKGVDSTDLAPLYHSVEPDALDSLFEHGFDGELTFRYEGYHVTVSGTGDVDVTSEKRR
ncbi:HalOD1 output domain-containing protein [Natrinema versiforme]|nr:HalOD1 output domain-containing protein [Natrinema versiforme]